MPASIKRTPIPVALIAPCGMNCRLCMAFGREKNPCPGCRTHGETKSRSCASCRIKNCEEMARDRRKYCWGCQSFPCARLKHLDKRYRTKYGMSMLENLEAIGGSGVRQFIRLEKAKWACPGCGQVLCVHRPHCTACGHKWR